MFLREMATTLAAYNRWVNRQIYAAAAPLSDADRRKPLGGSFGSVHGTLSHLIVADRLWLNRFRGEPLSAPAADPFPEFADLQAARTATDDDIDRWVATLDESFGERPFYFRSIAYNRDRIIPGWSAVLHLFNHQTHHRGQVHCLLTRITDAAPSLDLILYQREAGVGLLQRPPPPRVPIAAYDRKSRK